MPVEWKLALHDQFIKDRGDLVIHEAAIACPTCRGEDHFAGNLMWEGKPKKVRSLRCGRCSGDGYLYRNAKVLRGLVTGIQSGSNRQLIDVGFMVPGDCTFSPPPQTGSIIHDFDKITFTHAQSVNDGQVILRGAAHLGNNKQLETDLETNEDRLWYLADNTIWCEDENGVLYRQDADFKFVGKKIRWIGNAPKVGVSYSIKYMAYLEWMAFASPMERIDHGTNLAPKVMLRKKHVWFSTGSPAETPAERQEEQTNFTSRVKV